LRSTTSLSAKEKTQYLESLQALYPKLNSDPTIAPLLQNSEAKRSEAKRRGHDHGIGGVGQREADCGM
jgi:hypothetical protein